MKLGIFVGAFKLTLGLSVLPDESRDGGVRLLRLLHPEAMTCRFEDHLLRAFDALG